MIVTIDRAGRVVVPKRYRDRFNLVPGAALEIEATGDGLQLRKVGVRRLRLPGRRDPVLAGKSCDVLAGP